LSPPPDPDLEVSLRLDEREPPPPPPPPPLACCRRSISVSFTLLKVSAMPSAR
jgi:hypothetical protein